MPQNTVLSLHLNYILPDITSGQNFLKHQKSKTIKKHMLKIDIIIVDFFLKYCLQDSLIQYTESLR